ncbi:hypothetical protein EBU71_04060 [bacterium]|nr:hypothetical protein [Candidatus Elulimicrobium humile]
MATSVYFNNYNSIVEQRVLEDLIVESIKIMGFDGYYLPNDNDVARDLLFGEDPVKKFQSAFPLELYLSNALDYDGEKEFFSKFGLEIKNNINVIVSKRSFAQRVPQNNFTRPREGDLIYVPFLNGTGELYEIKFADQDKDFHTLGRRVPYFYELQLEKFKFSHEIIATGVQEIDDVGTFSSYTIQLNVGTGVGMYMDKEIVYQAPDSTQANATVVAIVQGWDKKANTLNVTNIAGEFITNRNIIGATSNAVYLLSNYDPLRDNQRDESSDNYIIENQANSIIDFSETNPFGSI